MKLVLDRTELERAIECFVKKQGITMKSFSVVVNTGGATVTLDPEDSEDSVEASSTMNPGVLPNEIVEEPEEVEPAGGFGETTEQSQ